MHYNQNVLMDRIFLTLRASKSDKRRQILDRRQPKLFDKNGLHFRFLMLYSAIVLKAPIRNSARLLLSRVNVETRATITFCVKVW